MSKPTSKEIRERHNELDNAESVSDILKHGHSVRNLLNQAHKDRGILLDRLETAEAKLKDRHKRINKLMKANADYLTAVEDMDYVKKLKAKLEKVRELIKEQREATKDANFLSASATIVLNCFCNSLDKALEDE